ncbi:hypothetical protein [Halomonas daqiaonensis]|uniref:hypothetical protein n=1 Tax=Halomonas daqiaonensis TaxID=650850 RepID=UPI00147F9EB6|nr:hypothetical protein [Halomonas daqiaonensis]
MQRQCAAIAGDALAIKLNADGRVSGQNPEDSLYTHCEWSLESHYGLNVLILFEKFIATHFLTQFGESCVNYN